jgi:electron transfer flavoprotein alpha subunit
VTPETKSLALLSPIQPSLGYAPEDAETLREILQALDDNDSGVIELSKEQMVELGSRLAAKIDAYRYIEDQAEADMKRLTATAKKFTAAKKQTEKAVKNLKTLLIYYMRSKEFREIPGNDWIAKLSTSQKVRVKKGEPTANDVMSHEKFVRIKYEWDKDALGEALKAGDETAKLIAEFEESYSAKFNVRKALKAKPRRKKG